MSKLIGRGKAIKKRQLFLIPPIAGYFSSPILVMLTTWLLYHLQLYVASQQNGSPTRPYGIVFLVAVWLLTAAAGRGPGILTLALSLFALDAVLIPPMFSFRMPVARNIVELIVLTTVGFIMIFAQDAYQRSQHRHMLVLERETLINKIGIAIRSTLNPVAVPEAAVMALGEALGVDRCYYSIYDIPRDSVLVGNDWRRADLPSLAGEYRLSDYSVNPQETYKDGTVQIVKDVRDVALSPKAMETLDTLRVRSGISVPIIVNGRLVAALAVAMSDVSRDWSSDDVAVVSAIATMTKSAFELAQLHQREVRISEALQGALMPTKPPKILGLDLASYYKACLEESNVGGDFSDIFVLDKGTFGLVVGDLSGKGLEAASQVATVRNMLRYSMYTEPDLGDAITRLNAVLAANRLISGFSTLAVGLFDTGARSMSYVSCGQDPLLLRRTANGDVEQLGPTGPVLGMDETAIFTALHIPLQAGDSFVLYTDGLTECGPNRRNLLGVDGMIKLLKNGSTRTADELMNDILDGAHRHATGDFTDDVCLMVGIVDH